MVIYQGLHKTQDVGDNWTSLMSYTPEYLSVLFSGQPDRLFDE